MDLLRKDNVEHEIQMVAMVDVVFILLSFFVLGMTFLVPERDLDLGYQQSSLAQGARREDFPELVRIRLQRSGQGVAISIGQAQLGNDNYSGICDKLTEIDMPFMDVVVIADPSLSVDEVARALDSVLASPMKRVSVCSLGPPSPQGVQANSRSLSNE